MPDSNRFSARFALEHAVVRTLLDIEDAPGKLNGARALVESLDMEHRAAAEDDAVADRLKALGHPVRLAIVKALAQGSCCCCADVCSRLPLAQSTVSQHLKVLKDAGLLTFRRDGVRSAYVLNPAAFAALRADLEEIAAMACAGQVRATGGSE